MSAVASAQSLPGHFQFGEKRLLADNTTCTFVSEVTIQGGFVLVAPLSRVCTNENDVFASDEGYVFPLGGRDAHSRDCLVPPGDDPQMTCSDGEKSTLRGFTADERLRIESAINRTANWTGSRLVLDLDDFETRYTMAGGSGRKPVKLRITYHLEFSFSAGGCTLEKIRRNRLVNNRNQNIISVQVLECKLLR